jgi:hypothetical protein
MMHAFIDIIGEPAQQESQQSARGKQIRRDGEGHARVADRCDQRDADQLGAGVQHARRDGLVDVESQVSSPLTQKQIAINSDVSNNVCAKLKQVDENTIE